MPVISLQIPVNELLETVRHLLANGKEVRAELLSAAMMCNDDDCPPLILPKTSLTHYETVFLH